MTNCHILSDPILAVYSVFHAATNLNLETVYTLNLESFEQRYNSRNLSLRLKLLESVLVSMNIEFERIQSDEALSLCSSSKRVTTDSYMLSKRLSEKFSLLNSSSDYWVNQEFSLYSSMADMLIAENKFPFYFRSLKRYKTRYLWNRELKSQLVSRYHFPNLPNGPEALSDRPIYYFDPNEVSTIVWRVLFELQEQRAIPKILPFLDSIVVLSPELDQLETSIPILNRQIKELKFNNSNNLFLLKPHPSKPMSLETFKELTNAIPGNHFPIDSQAHLDYLTALPLEYIFLTSPYVKFIGSPTGALSFVNSYNSIIRLIATGNDRLDHLYETSYYAWYHYWAGESIKLVK